MDAGRVRELEIHVLCTSDMSDNNKQKTFEYSIYSVYFHFMSMNKIIYILFKHMSNITLVKIKAIESLIQLN